MQLVLLLWCYFKVVFKDPGSVPENWRPMRLEENLEGGSCINESDYGATENLGSTWSASDGLDRKDVGYCNHCKNGKPPRCHHCSVCKPAYNNCLQLVVFFSPLISIVHFFIKFYQFLF